MRQDVSAWTGLRSGSEAASTIETEKRGLIGKRTGLLLVLQFLLICGMVFAQTITSSIVGNVSDPSGRPIEGATVAVQDVGTGVTIRAQTDAHGAYTVPGLLAGVFNVTISKPGFQSFRTTGVRLFSSVTARVNARLTIGSVQQTVTVTGAGSLLHTDTMGVSESISSAQLANLPTEKQTVDAFIALAPGVQSFGDATNPIIGGGSHWGSVNFTLNGVEVNDPGNSGAVTVQGVGLLVLPPPSSIQELHVQSNNMSAQFAGHSAVTLVTKAGTNRFHGLLYEYFQNTVLNANSFVLNEDGKPRAAAHLNQFGGNLGGPIWRQKAFFFFDYNGYRDSHSRINQLTLPSEAMQKGDFSGLGATQLYDPYTGKPFPGNQIPDTMIAPQAKTLLKYLPAPTDSTSLGLPSGGINFVQAVPLSQNVDSADVRIDYDIAPSDRIFGVYARRVADPWNAGTDYPADYGQGRYGYKDTTLSGTWTHTFNANTLNDLRVAWGDYATKFSGMNQDINPQSLFPQQPTTMYRGLPTTTISGYTGMFHDYGTGLYTPRWDVEFTDNFTHIIGGHTIEMGLDETGYKINSRSPSVGKATGSFSFNGKWTGNRGWPDGPHSAGNAFADFLLGDASASSTAPVGAFAANVYSRDWGAYVQDTWQATPHLTLIYGLRYEYQSPWLYRGQTVTTFDMKNDKLVLPQNSPTPTLPQGAYGVGVSADLFNAYPFETTQSIGLPLHYIKPDRNNFAPRLGFSYRPFNHTVVSGGFGIYYNFQPGNVGSRADIYNPPWELSIVQDYTSELPGKPKTPYLPDITFANPFPGVNGKSTVSPNPKIDFLQWNFQNAATNEWNLTVEQQMGNSWAIRASYVGHHADHLPFNFGPVNVPAVQIPNEPIQKQRPFQPFGAINETRSVGIQNFNQLQLGVQKRFTNGFSFQGQYQYSRSLDDVTRSGGPQQWREPMLDYGNSDDLSRHWLVFNYIYQLPFGKGMHWLAKSGGVTNAVLGGWQISGITTYGSGNPFSVDYSQTGTGVAGWWPGRADRVKGVPLYKGRQSGSHDIKNGVQWFNTAAFAPPTKWTWGNSARNLLFGPGLWNWDMSGMKTFGLTERVHLQFRADFLDAFNHFNLGNPGKSIADIRDGGNPVANAGQIVGGSGSRVVQLSMNLKF